MKRNLMYAGLVLASISLMSGGVEGAGQRMHRDADSRYVGQGRGVVLSTARSDGRLIVLSMSQDRLGLTRQTLSIDEADRDRVRPGAPVSFSVFLGEEGLQAASLAVTDEPEIIVIDEDVDDDLFVDEGDLVILADGATVEGNAEVRGTLVLVEASEVKGNVKGLGHGAFLVVSEFSSVDGNVEGDFSDVLLEAMSSVDGNVVIGLHGLLLAQEASIQGDLKVEGDGMSTVLVFGCWISGNIETYMNDEIEVSGSHINGNIKSEDDGFVTLSNNDVNGSIEVSGAGSCFESGNTVNGGTYGC